MAFRLFSLSRLPEIMGGGGASISASGSKDVPSSSSSALLENTRRWIFFGLRKSDISKWVMLLWNLFNQ